MKRTTYTQRQMDIISGEIAIEDISTRTLNCLLRDAVAFGDQQTAAFVEPFVVQRQEAAKERNLKRTKEHYHSTIKPFRKSHEDGWTALMPIKTDSTEYTERQKKIIRGEIPYEEAQTRDFKRIAAVATNRGDFDIAEMMEGLACEKHADAVERNREGARKRHAEIAKARNPGSYDADGYRTYLNGWERDIIASRADPGDYSLEVLENILEIAKRIEDEQAVRIMEFLIRERIDPSSVYSVKTKEDAIRLIASHTIFLICMPKDLLDKEETPP